MSKKIAIQLFGHLRTFKAAYPYFYKNVIIPNQEKGYDIDIFIHTWNEYEHATVNYRNPKGIAPKNNTLSEEDIVEIKNLYGPKKLKIDAQLDCEDIMITEQISKVQRSYKGCVNNAFTIFEVNRLRLDYEKENNIKYDWVLQTRPDVLFKTVFCLDEFLEVYQRLDISIPEKALFYAYNPFNGKKVEDLRFISGSDLIYFAKPQNMDKATQLYADFEKNIDIHNFPCFEVWWMDFWKKQGLEPLPLKYHTDDDWIVLRQKMLPYKDKGTNRNTKKIKIKILGITLFKMEITPKVK